MKNCGKCKKLKDDSEFSKSSRSPSGLRSYCKLCSKKLYQLNKEKVLQGHKEYYEKNKESITLWRKQWREENKDMLREKSKIKYNKYKNENKNFHLLCNLRSRLNSALKIKNVNKAVKTIELLGCSIDEYKLYLESLWVKGMSWDNYGIGKNKWQVDHIIPCSFFDLTKEEEQKKCFHYTNLMPLWFSDNEEKGIKVFQNRDELQIWLEIRGYQIPEKFNYLS